MGRKSSSKPTPELPGCFNGMWNAAADAEETPVLARKSLSERKFSEGFEAPRNSLDIASAIFERHNAAVAVAASSNDEIPFGFEFAVEAVAAAAPMRITVPNGAASMVQDSSNSSRCRSPSVIARLMGLDTLPAEQQSAKQQQQQSSTNKTADLQAWRVMSERRELLSSRSSREHRTQEKPLMSRQLSSSRLRDWPLKMSSEVQPEDELLLFDVLPFRDHPQEKQLEKLKHKFEAQRQLEEQQLKKQQLQVQRSSKSNCNSSIPIAAEKLLEVATTKRNPESREMLDAIQFLQSNKEFLVKFLREPNSVFAKHIYDLQALAAKEVDAEAARSKSVINKAPREIVVAQIHHHHQQQQQQDNIGFSRKLVETKKDHQKLTRSNNTNKKEVVQKQRKDNAHDKIVLLKPNNVKKQSSSLSGSNTPTSRTKSAGDFRGLKDVDPKELARQIARQARENVSKELDSKNSSSCSWSGQMINEVDVGGGEGSEPSSRRYTKDFQVSTSLPNSPKLSSKSKSNVSSKEGRKQLMEKLKSTQSSEDLSKELFIQIELEKQQQQQQESLPEPKKAKGGKLLKLFSRDSSPQKVASSDKSPRLLVRSKSVPSFVEEKNQGPAVQALDRTHSCKQPKSPPPCESSKGKFSSLKSSLLGKKKGHHQHQHSRAAASDGGSPTSSSSGKSQSSECREIEHSVVYEDHYIRTFRETEAQLASTYGGGCNSGNKFSFDAQSPRFLSVDISESPDASSEIHRDKSEQPSPVSVLERGFIEESPSPVSFEDVSSDLQELQVRLERLKLDESGRSYDVIPAESGFDIVRRRQGDLDASPSPSPHCSPASQDQHYISKLIHASGLSDSLGSLFTWHTPSCPIDPFLFAKMEEDYSGSEAPSICGVIKRHRKLKIGRSFNAQVQRRPETLHRQMIFDVVNEVLAKKFQHLWNEQPWQEIGKQGIKAVPSGKHLLLEVGKEMEVFRHDYDSCEYPLENLVERDVNRGGQWMDTRDELRKITSQVEAGIFNSLVEELAMSFIR